MPHFVTKHHCNLRLRIGPHKKPSCDKYVPSRHGKGIYQFCIKKIKTKRPGKRSSRFNLMPHSLNIALKRGVSILAILVNHVLGNSVTDLL